MIASVSFITHLILITTTSRLSFNADDSVETGPSYATANGLAGSLVHSMVDGLLIYGIIKVFIFFIKKDVRIYLFFLFVFRIIVLL